MNWKKWLVFTLSSALFMPISCTSITMITTPALSHLGAQHPDRGEPVPPSFEVAVIAPNGRDFQIELLRGVASRPIAALTPQLASSVKATEFGEHSFQVLKRQPLTIEVINRDDDYTTFNEYRIDNGKIIPLKYRILGPSQGFVGLLLGLIFAYATRAIAIAFKQEANPRVSS